MKIEDDKDADKDADKDDCCRRMAHAKKGKKGGD